MVLSFPFVRLGCAAWESYFGPGLIVELVRLALVMCIPWVTFALAWRHETLGGLAEVFKSNVWTLTYRELRALEGLEPEPGELPEPDTADVE
jgi:hypothetical protein